MKRAKDLCGTRPVMMKKLNISLIKKPSYIENVAALKLETQKAWQKRKEKFSIVKAYIDARKVLCGCYRAASENSIKMK